MSITFAKAANDYLRVAGETLKDFTGEIKKLTKEDREVLILDFEKMGVEITK